MTIVFKVNEKQEVIIERFGKYVKTVKDPGLHFLAPFSFQEIARRVDTDVFQIEAPLTTKTSDDLFVTVPTKLQLQVVDSTKFHYYAKNGNPVTQVESRIIAVMKQLTSGMEFAHLYQARETLGHNVREKVGRELEEEYGIKIVDVIGAEPQASHEIQDSYNRVRQSEREAQAKVNLAQAAKQAAILEAEGRKEVLRLDGEGVAAQRAAILENYAEQHNKLLAQGLSPQMAFDIIIKAMDNDMLRDAAKQGNMMIIQSGDKPHVGELAAEFQAVGKMMNKPREHASNDDAPRARPAAKGPEAA